jgi:hypothetical protein
MIEIRMSPTADTRTCDWSKTTKEQLVFSSLLHIQDVGKGLGLLAGMLVERAASHDYDKISDIEQFHADFATGFTERSWWVNHLIRNRHHLQEEHGVRRDVNLIDVLEHIVDCVMAGLARSGEVYKVELPSNRLQVAMENTVEMLKRHITVIGLREAKGGE